MFCGHDPPVLWYNPDMKSRSRRGQTAVEYLIAFCALLVAAAALTHVLRATRGCVARTEKLVGADYP